MTTQSERVHHPISTKELERRWAAVQDGTIEAAMKAVAPGKREIGIAAVAEHFVLGHGGEQGLFMCCSHAGGEPTYWGNRHVQNRTLREGDMFTLLTESNGPGGFYTEISRACVLGKAPQELRVAIQSRTVKMAKFFLVTGFILDR